MSKFGRRLNDNDTSKSGSISASLPDSSALGVDGMALRSARLQKGLTQEDLAETTRPKKLTKRTIERMEKGGRAYTRSIRAVAEALGVSYESLIVSPQLTDSLPTVPGRQELKGSHLTEIDASINSLQLISGFVKQYGSEKMGRALRSVATKKIPRRIGGTELDTDRRCVVYFWTRMSVDIKAGLQETQLRELFAERFLDLWPKLERLEKLKFTEGLRRKRFDKKEIAVKLTRWLELHPVHWLYERWRATEQSTDERQA